MTTTTETFDLNALLGDVFRDKVTVSKLDPSTKGKVFFFYGGNNLGKTTNASKFPNPVFIPLEKGMNGVSNANVLKTATYTDVRNYVRTLITNPRMLKALETQEITIVIDGVEKLGMLCQRMLCSKHGIDDISEGKGGYGLWGYYEKEIANFVNDITSAGYTLVFIGHAQESKEGFVSPKGDKRNVAPIVDVCDFVVYLTSNGTEEGEVVKSSAWLAETEYFFARSRFPYVPTYIKEFTAENLIEAVRVGIETQIEAEGAEVSTFADQIEMYSSAVTLTFEETIEALVAQYDQLSNIDRLDVWEEVVSNHLEGIAVSEAKPSQIESLHAIYLELTDFLNSVAQ